MNHTITQSFGDIFKRPADANYDSMEELLTVSKEEMDQSRVLKVSGSDVKFSTKDQKIQITAKNESLPLTNYALTQVAGMAKIQTHVLERLHLKSRDDLIVDNLNTLFPNHRSETKFVLVRDNYEDDGTINSVARAVNGGAYSRLWDFEVFTQIKDFLTQEGFTPMLPEMTPSAMRNGLMYGLDTGLFRGDQCSFGFFFTEKEIDNDSEDLGGLQPGMMIFNSEVGARSFGFHTFYYHKASGSVIVWTPANHKRKRFVHRGNISNAFKEYVNTLEDVAENFQDRYVDDVKTFTAASAMSFACDENAAIERLHNTFKMSTVDARAAIQASKQKQNLYGDPLSVWNVALGIAYEAGQMSRAETLVDGTMVATKIMRVLLKK